MLKKGIYLPHQLNYTRVTTIRFVHINVVVFHQNVTRTSNRTRVYFFVKNCTKRKEKHYLRCSPTNKLIKEIVDLRNQIEAHLSNCNWFNEIIKGKDRKPLNIIHIYTQSHHKSYLFIQPILFPFLRIQLTHFPYIRTEHIFHNHMYNSSCKIKKSIRLTSNLSEFTFFFPCIFSSPL